MKIKVFKFRVSNAASEPFSEDIGKDWYAKRKGELVSETEIASKVNRFIQGKRVINILVNNVDVHYHNNGRGNTVDLVYTIMYEE